MSQWIESHASLRHHPKLRRLSRLLKINYREATGLLHWLWWWALDYAPDGNLERYSVEDIADAIDWDGDPSDLLEALRISGFVDDWRLHDWEEYGGKLDQRRLANAERMRKAREARTKGSSSSFNTDEDHVQCTCDTHAAHVRDTCGARGQDKTGQDNTGQIPSGGALPPQTAQQLVAHYVDEHARLGLSKPSRQRVGQAAKAVAERLAAGVPSATIAAALTLAVEKARSPAMLDLLVAEVEKPPPRRRASNVDRALELVRRYETKEVIDVPS